MPHYIKPSPKHDAMGVTYDSAPVELQGFRGEPLDRGTLGPGSSIKLTNMVFDHCKMLSFGFTTNDGNFRIRYGTPEKHVALVFRRNGVLLRRQNWRAGWKRNTTTNQLDTSTDAFTALPVTLDDLPEVPLQNAQVFPGTVTQVRTAKLTQYDVRRVSDNSQYLLPNNSKFPSPGTSPQWIGGQWKQPWEVGRGSSAVTEANPNAGQPIPGGGVEPPFITVAHIENVTVTYVEETVQEWYDVTLEVQDGEDYDVVAGPVAIPDRDYDGAAGFFYLQAKEYQRQYGTGKAAQGMLAIKETETGIEVSAVVGPRYGGRTLGWTFGSLDPALHFPFGDFFGGDTGHLIATAPEVSPQWWLDGLETPEKIRGTTLKTPIGDFAATDGNGVDIYYQPGYVPKPWDDQSQWLKDSRGRLRPYGNPEATLGDPTPEFYITPSGVCEGRQLFFTQSQPNTPFTIRGAVVVGEYPIVNQYQGADADNPSLIAVGSLSLGWYPYYYWNSDFVEELFYYRSIGGEFVVGVYSSDVLGRFAPPRANTSLYARASVEWDEVGLDGTDRFVSFTQRSLPSTPTEYNLGLVASQFSGFLNLRECGRFDAVTRLHHESIQEEERLDSENRFRLPWRRFKNTTNSSLILSDHPLEFQNATTDFLGNNFLSSTLNENTPTKQVVATVGDFRAMAFEYNHLPALLINNGAPVPPVAARVTVSNYTLTPQNPDVQLQPGTLVVLMKTTGVNNAKLPLNMMYGQVVHPVDGQLKKIWMVFYPYLNVPGREWNTSYQDGVNTRQWSDSFPANMGAPITVADPETGLVDISCTKTTGLMRKTIVQIIGSGKNPIDLWHDNIGNEVGLAETLSSGYGAFLNGSGAAAFSEVGDIKIEWLWELPEG